MRRPPLTVGLLQKAKHMATKMKTAPLGELVRFASGGTPDRSKTRFWNGEIPWLSAKDLKKFRLTDSIEKITPEGASNGTRLVEAGTVLILVRGMTLLKDVPVGVAERPVCFNQDLKALIPNGGIDGYYLGYYLAVNKNRLLTFVDQAGHGTGRLPSDLLYSFEIDLPDQQTQRKMADLLLAWDRSIEQVEEQIVIKARFKRGLMQQLLTGRKRFKEFDNQQWKTIELREVGRIESGGTPDTALPENWGGLINWCTPTDIASLQTRYLGPTARKLSDRGLKSSSAKLLPANSVIVCTRATIGGCAINALEMATNQGFKSIVPNESVDAEFLYYSMLSNKKHLLRLSAGSTFAEISKSDFERITISLPPHEEQRRIAAVLNACERELDLMRRQLAALKRQKQGLMQKLLTGQINVRV